MRPIYLSCFRRDSYKCRHCGNRNGIHPHHVIYKSHGGKDELNNLITLCHQCHLEGVHKHKLEITVLDTTENDVVVSFKRLKNWIPK
jgi:5-methylcytosine-specific restriction endonuclease McrA